jgi:glutamyl-tRNA reductase
VLKNLASHKNVSVTAAVRSHGGSFELVKTAPNVTAVEYSDRYKYADCADCIISATSSPHYTVTAQDLQAAVSADKPRLLIDLAVPPDIDCAVANIKNVRLIGIDYFERLAAENNALKSDSAQTASAMIDEQLDELKKELCFRSFLPQIKSVREGLRDVSFEETLYRMKSRLDSKSLAAVLDVLKTFGGGEG